jgi:mono/diheme cytochrome c family protein
MALFRKRVPEFGFSLLRKGKCVAIVPVTSREPRHLRSFGLPWLAAMVAALISPSLRAFDRTLLPFLETHCFECHGEDVQKAKLRFDTLSPDLSDPRSLDIWTRVHDRIRAGEMPPEKQPQPSPGERTSTVAALHEDLHKASRSRQLTQGRVALRRLNGTEYENTVRELLGTDVKLKELLPEDNSAAGFDNVSEALDLSPTHFLLYQEAAAKAVASVVPVHPPIPIRERRSGREMSEKGSNFQQTLDRSCRLDGDALLIYSKLPRYGLACTASAPGKGRYRIRMSASAVGASGKPVAAAFAVVGRTNDPPVVRELVDFQPGPPRIIETEVDLEWGEAFVVNLLLNWDIRSTKEPIEAYQGPGLRIEWLEIEGPVGDFPPASFRRLFGESTRLVARSAARAERQGKTPSKLPENRNIYGWINDPLEPVSANPREDSERLLRDFLPRAFRRPVPEELQQHYLSLVREKLDTGDSFLEALSFGYRAILTSPHFLLLLEPGPNAARDGSETLASTKLDGYALANRLSYFLHGGPPDEALLAAAADGSILGDEGLRKQTERLLGSPRARRFTENFTGQWLDLRKMDATIPDPNLYGDFDGTLLWAMPRETWHFFDEVLKEDRSLLEFIDSDWTFVNARLADHYGLPGITGNELRRVSLPPGSPRGGVMTHASVLKVTADGTTTSPILRGKWVLERILGTPPSPPPPDIPAIEPDIRGATTIRQQLEKHRSVASCNSCHRHIDPPGFALESFDPIGGYREFYRASSRTERGIASPPGYPGRAYYRGPDVEKGGVTDDGRAFETIDDYRTLLLSDPDLIARNLTGKMITYATGAPVQYADREVVEAIVATLREKNYGFRTLIHEVVQSRVFRNK